MAKNITNKAEKPQVIEGPIELGDKVEDLVSGLSGIATSRSVRVTGLTQVAITPRVDEKGEAYFIDPEQLKIVEKQVLKHTPIPANVPDLLGSKVTHKVTEFKGVAVERVEFLNGCVSYSVQGKVTKEHPKGVVNFDSYKMFEVTKENAIDLADQKKPAAEKTGGPSRRACDVM